MTLSFSTPFRDAQEAWFWSLRCQKARDDGMKFVRDMGDVVRPCFPDDIFRVIKRLALIKSLSRAHVDVLWKYGNLERPPDPRCEEEAPEALLWDQALDRMTTILRTKEIVQ